GGGTATSFNSGDRTWSNPENALTEDGNFASIDGFGTTDQLRITNFGFNVSGTISGISVRIKWQGAEADEFIEDVISLLYNDTLIGDNKATGSGIPSTLTNKTFGGESDTW